RVVALGIKEGQGGLLERPQQGRRRLPQGSRIASVGEGAADVVGALACFGEGVELRRAEPIVATLSVVLEAADPGSLPRGTHEQEQPVAIGVAPRRLDHLPHSRRGQLAHGIRTFRCFTVPTDYPTLVR